jgi:prepilin-type N-terminal cleavage/methylation domain-containing protein
MFFKHKMKHDGKQGRSDQGFTIIEVLMALAIFAIGILAVAKMQLTSVNGNTSARKYTEASTWGVSEIENIMSTAYDDAALDDGTTGTVVQGIYTVNWTVTEAVPIPNVKQIDIVVTWDNNKTFSASYYKAIIF